MLSITTLLISALGVILFGDDDREAEKIETVCKISKIRSEYNFHT